MTDKPILMSAAMVRACMREIKNPGTGKTQTRRVVTLPEKRILKKYGEVQVKNVSYYAPPSGRSQAGWTDPGVNYHTFNIKTGEMIGNHIDPCPYGQPGDLLWVRDTQSLDAALATLDRIGAALDRTIESFGSAANG